MRLLKILRKGPPLCHSDRWIETRWGTVRARVLGEQNRTTVLLVPDPPNTLDHQQSLLDELARDHCVIAFESPGFGYSKARPEYKFTLDQNADVMVDVLDSITARDVTLALTCVSALAGLKAAQRRQDLITHLVFAQVADLSGEQAWAKRMDIKGILAMPGLGQFFMKVAKRWVATHWYKIALPRGMDIRSFVSGALESFSRGASFHLASAFQALHKEVFGSDFQVQQKAAVIWGLADRTHRKTDKRSVLRYLPNAAYYELAECGHCPDLEFSKFFAHIIREVRKPASA